MIWWGEILTEPKSSVTFDARRINPAQLRLRLRNGEALVRAPGSRFGFVPQGRTPAFFVDQPSRSAPAADRFRRRALIEQTAAPAR